MIIRWRQAFRKTLQQKLARGLKPEELKVRLAKLVDELADFVRNPAQVIKDQERRIQSLERMLRKAKSRKEKRGGHGAP